MLKDYPAGAVDLYLNTRSRKDPETVIAMQSIPENLENLMQSGNHAMALDVEERRSERRHAILVRANIDIPGKVTLSGHAVDVSRGGMGLQCPVDVSLGTELTVTLPLEVCGEQRTVSLPGRVCYCNKQTDAHFRVGLQFVHLDDDTTAFINALCP